jgi:hypothetical protein
MIEFFPERTVLPAPADQPRRRELTSGSSRRAPSASVLAGVARDASRSSFPRWACRAGRGRGGAAGLRDNVAGAALTLSADDLAELNKIGS